MANTLTAVTPKLLAQGLMALREIAVMPRLVNRRYEEMAGDRGSTIDVPIPSAIAAVAVSPGPTPPTTADMAPTSVPIVLDQWYEAPFYLTDKDILEAMEGTIPMQASEAVKSLANNVDTYLLGLYKDFYGYHGTAGTTPFSSGTTTDATQIRKVLNNQLAPLDPRHVVMNPDTEAKALDIRAFQDASYSGSVQAILEGRLNTKLGFAWWMDQNAPFHTNGTADAAWAVNNGAGYAAGISTINVDALGAGSETVTKGTLITFAGHSQSYVVTANFTASSGAVTGLTIKPALQAAVADNEVITVVGSHEVNLAFHRDAIAFANRPLARHGSELGVISATAVDDITGLALRLEVTHEHKRLRWSYDILYGAAVVRRELGARLIG